MSSRLVMYTLSAFIIFKQWCYKDAILTGLKEVLFIQISLMS